MTGIVSNPCLLAAAVPPGKSSSDLIFWTMVLFGVLVGMGVLGALIYKFFTRQWSDDGADGQGFTLGDLRKMRAAGQISEEEYQSARLLIIGRAKAMIAQPPTPTQDPPDEDPNDDSSDNPKA